MKGHVLDIVRAMESGAERVKEFVELTGTPLDQCYARLHELKRMGVVRSFRVPGGKWRGSAQREKRYKLIREQR
jgi:DNA-binding IclR family transcriptional regulator